MSSAVLELSANGKKLKAEIARVFGGIGPEAEKAAGEIAARFDKVVTPGLRATEKKIQDTLRRAMAATTGDSGVIDLDLPGMRAGALAADQKAAAARKLAEAMEAVHRSTSNVTKAQQLELQAAQAVATKFEQQAAAAREEVVALERLQRELGQVTIAQNNAGKSANANSYAWQNAGYQAQDFFVQIAGGTSVIRAFSLQMPQMIGALQMMGNNADGAKGKFAAFTSFLAGPWGIALGVAIPVAGILIEHLTSMGDASDSSRAKIDALSRSLQLLERTAGRPNMEALGKVAVQAAADRGAARILDGKIADAKALYEALKMGPPQASTAAYNKMNELIEKRAKLLADAEAAELRVDIVRGQVAAREKGAADGVRATAEEKAEKEATKKRDQATRKAESAAERAVKAGQKQVDLITAFRAGVDGAAGDGMPKLNAQQEKLLAAARFQLEIQQQVPSALAAQYDIQKGIADTMLQQVLHQEELLRLKGERQARAAELKPKDISVEDIATKGMEQSGRAIEVAREQMFDLARDFEDILSGGMENFWRGFERMGLRAVAKIAAEQGLGVLGKNGKDTLGRLAGGFGYGAAGASLVGGNSLLGGVGGIAGNELGKSIGKSFAGEGAKGLTKMLGDMAGPLGGIVGGIAGSLIGSLLTKAPKASAVVSSLTAPAQVTGNNQAMQQALSGLTVDLQSSLTKIIEQLGGEAGQFLVSIGQYKDYYRVKSDGSTNVGEKHPGDANLIYNGQDASEALRIAILDALRDGAVGGISETIKRLITSNPDIELGVSKATRLQTAFKDLKALTDPMGAAIDAVNLKFKQLITIAKEAGGTGDEMAQLEELYKREREAAIKSAGAASETLKTFLQNLRAGSASPLGLREQAANAQSALDPFRQAILSGKSVDIDAFQRAAQTSLDVARQRYGSTQAYFDQFNAITSLTEKAIAQIDAQAAGKDQTNPFDKAIASSSQAAANLLEQQSRQMEDQTSLLRQIAQATGADVSTWLDQRRGY